MTEEILKLLAEPFDASVIEWRAGATNSEKTKALALAYAPARVYMERLDEVMGFRWKDEYRAAPDGGVLCGVSLFMNNEWITRWDGADNTDFEAVKGGLSDAFKRACVKWGIGRYLYSVPAQWVKCEQRGKSVVLLESPRIDGSVERTKKEPPAQKIPAKEKDKSIYEYVVEAGLSENAHSAKAALAKCKTGYADPAAAMAWMANYRKWREVGLESQDAANKANAGEE